jgi:hypothetical protein
VSTWKSGSTALTGLTQSTLKWSGDIAFAAGAIWGEWFPTSFERNVPNGGLIAVYFTAASGAGSNMNFHVSLESQSNRLRPHAGRWHAGGHAGHARRT